MLDTTTYIWQHKVMLQLLTIHVHSDGEVGDPEGEDDEGEDEPGHEDEGGLGPDQRGLPGLVLVPLRDVLDQDVEDEDGEGEGQAEDEPHVDELDVGGGGQLVGDCHVEGVHHQHGCDGHGHVGLEVLLLEVERGLADEHEAEGGHVGVEQVVLVQPLQQHLHLVR